MNADEQVVLNKFKPRAYQYALCDAIENKGYKKVIVNAARRWGKDITCFNIVSRQAIQDIGIYYYLLPTHVQARQVMFDGITTQGTRIIDEIDKRLVKKINSQEMKITLINNSIIQFCGSNKFDRLRGTNPKGIVFSEYAYQHPQVYPTLSPALEAHNGFAIFISTPFGENHFFDLWKVAQRSEEWFSITSTIEDAKHMSIDKLNAQIASGEITPDMALQEYYCSFSVGAIGAYYAKYLNKMELNGQIGEYSWESDFPVHTVWDLGVNDQTCILFFQIIGNSIHIIDMYIASDVGMEHYINFIKSKPYTYSGTHVAPHDIKVREYTSGGMSRLEKASNLGINFIVAPHMTIMDGIESVRTTLPRMKIDMSQCNLLVAALRNYRKKYNSETMMYDNKPLHDKNSHICDALRYLCISLPQFSHVTSARDLDQRYYETVYGVDTNMPDIFRDDVRGNF